MESLDDDFIRFLNETDITNDVVAWDGEVIEIQDSDLDFIHSQCSSGPNSQRSGRNFVKKLANRTGVRRTGRGRRRPAETSNRCQNTDAIFGLACGWKD